MSHRRWWLAGVTLALAVFGLALAVATFDGGDAYRDIARASGVAGATFHRDGATWRVNLDTMAELHERTLEYVLGASPDLPRFGTTAAPLFEPSEASHLADVRNLFFWLVWGFRAAALVVIGLAFRMRETAIRGLARDAALLSAAVVGVTAVGAAVAFDPLFLVFHEVLFPQGNFLFPPDSNLITLYPDAYWYGVTWRVGVGFVVAMLLLGAALTATLRGARR